MAQDSAMLVIACSCGQKMKVPAEALGKTATCVKCGERLRITVETADPSESAMASTPRANASKSTPPPSTEPDPVRLLLQHGLVNENAIREAQTLQQDFDRQTWHLVIDLGHVTPDDFHAVMAKQKGIASIDLPNYHIPREVLDIVPAELAHRGMFVPVDRLGKLLTLAMACPIDTAIIHEVEEHTGLRVKRMLSPVEDIRRMLEACYPQFTRLMYLDESEGTNLYKEFEALLGANEAARRVMALESLPPFAQTAEDVRAVLDASSNGACLPTVTDLVAMDPVATAMLLRVTNSDAYGFPRRVDGLGLACTLLGPRGVGAVVDSVEPKDYRAAKDGFDYESFWARNQFCADAAQGIAMRIDSQSSITAYTAALLHDLGRLALLQAVPRSYPALSSSAPGASRHDTERRIYHLTSAEAGYMLARKWNFPHSLAEVIHFHRTPERAKQARELTNIVALAVQMADAFENGGSLNLDEAERCLSVIELGRNDAVEVFQEARKGAMAESEA